MALKCCIRPATHVHCLCHCNLLKGMQFVVVCDISRGMFYVVILILAVATWARHPESPYLEDERITDTTDRLCEVFLGTIYVCQGLAGAISYNRSVVLRHHSFCFVYIVLKLLFIVINVITPLVQKITFCERKEEYMDEECV